MKRQQGLVLVAVLVVLVIVLLAGLSAMRSVQTGNAVAGNFAFRQAAMQASDRAVDDALAAIATQVAGGGGNNALANRYLPVIDTTVNALGVPAAIDWTQVSCADEKGRIVADCAADDGNYRVQYVVERRCKGIPDFLNIQDIRARCEYEPTAAAVSVETIALRYRVLVRVRGPRGTESWFEAMVSGPAST
jgi:type IV pilus assembly protein PilX